MSISSTGPCGYSRRLRLAARQVIGRHRIVVIRQSGMVSTRLAASEYLPGMPTSALGGVVGPGLLWPLP
jgi:hypothetical protein